MQNHTKNFQLCVLRWYDQHGRKDLPWQQEITPYKVWLSEIMLQQTQVKTVIPYFEKFIAHFPDIHHLARANLDTVLTLWAGLGYYARARNLHKTARLVSETLQGKFPDEVELLAKLPGIGLSTAGAIVATAFEKPATILDGNVKRVLARHFAIAGWPGQQSTLTALWDIAKEMTPRTELRAYTQAMMDLGATICTRTKPLCTTCPIQQTCQAFAQGNPMDYPGKKAKPTLPIKSTIMLVVENSQNQLCLKKRPPTGIWGGLWSLPELENLDDLNADELMPLTQFRHTFSHYHLDIQAFYLRQTQKKPLKMIQDNPHITWLTPAELPNIGKPAAVEKILIEYLRMTNNDLA